ncbi:hypothetical protein ACFQX6_00520 [Streptosporangium lutulentum]
MAICRFSLEWLTDGRDSLRKYSRYTEHLVDLSTGAHASGGAVSIVADPVARQEAGPCSRRTGPAPTSSTPWTSGGRVPMSCCCATSEPPPAVWSPSRSTVASPGPRCWTPRRTGPTATTSHNSAPLI